MGKNVSDPSGHRVMEEGEVRVCDFRACDMRSSTERCACKGSMLGLMLCYEHVEILYNNFQARVQLVLGVAVKDQLSIILQCGLCQGLRHRG